MKRFVVLLTLVAITVPVSMNLMAAGDEPAPLVVKKECVVFGRILGSHLMMYSREPIAEPVYDPGSELPTMTQIQGFDILNTATGEWHPLTLSGDGYFCANIGMGLYEMRVRASDGKPYLIHSFNIPRGMAINLGSFWVEARNPDVVSRGSLRSDQKEAGWHEYREGTSSISLRFEHITSTEIYEECENWFAQCHGEAFEQFSSVIARR